MVTYSVVLKGMHTCHRCGQQQCAPEGAGPLECRDAFGTDGVLQATIMGHPPAGAA